MQNAAGRKQAPEGQVEKTQPLRPYRDARLQVGALVAGELSAEGDDDHVTQDGIDLAARTTSQS